MGRPASVRWVKDEMGFQALKAAWNQLAGETNPECVFLRHEWFEAAWEWRKTECELRVLYIFDRQEPLGIFPLVLERRGNGAIRQLSFLEIPDSQSCDILVARQNRDTVVRAIVDEFFATRHGWDMLRLSRISSDSPILEPLFFEMVSRRLFTTLTPCGKNLRIDLKVDWPDYYSKRSRSLKKGNNLAANRLRKTGKVEVVQVDELSADPATIAKFVRLLCRISSKSWKKSTGLTLDHAGPGRFIHCLTRHASEQGWLSVWLLTIDGEAVAMEYQIVYGGQVHALRADFDAAYSHLSPGSYLNWKLLEALFGSGRRNYYMGAGNNAYKLRWSEEGESLLQLNAYSPHLRGAALRFADVAVRPSLKRFKEWVLPTREPSAPDL
ncbi:MAG: GNAT family N-acetyltransferase [Burkholderiales bacterium]|nr:GNAT family N-acetyltransferase [Burkholderiales bacterium]